MSYYHAHTAHTKWIDEIKLSFFPLFYTFISFVFEGMKGASRWRVAQVTRWLWMSRCRARTSESVLRVQHRVNRPNRPHHFHLLSSWNQNLHLWHPGRNGESHFRFGYIDSGDCPLGMWFLPPLQTYKKNLNLNLLEKLKLKRLTQFCFLSRWRSVRSSI